MMGERSRSLGIGRIPGLEQKCCGCLFEAFLNARGARGKGGGTETPAMVPRGRLVLDLGLRGDSEDMLSSLSRRLSRWGP